VATSAGDHVATGAATVVVTVRPRPGFVLSQSPTWTHTYPTGTPSQCVTSVVAAAASFTDPVCKSGRQVVLGSYTVPQTTGVRYRVGGATVAAGTHPAETGSTITIAAGARTGYRLSGITQWTHTFTAPKQCVATAGGQVTPPSNTPPATSTPVGTAATGAPVQQILLAGIALILMGAACFVAAAVRRRGLPAT
jgi:hypothetical protein